MSDIAFLPTLKRFLSRFSILFKLAVIGFLLLLMCIPLSMVESQLSDRLNRRNNAIKEINATWGASQEIIGPILKLPYVLRTKIAQQKDIDGKMQTVEVEKTSIDYAFFLPRNLEILGKVEPQKLHRSIYEAIVYQARCEVSGTFDFSGLAELKIDPKDVRWQEAQLCMRVNDLRGASERIPLQFGGVTSTFLPGSDISGNPSGIHAPVKGLESASQPSAPYTFSFALSLNGSETLAFAPVGTETKVRLSSPWPDPSFYGKFLPSERDVRPEGFTASWNLSYYGRNYPQQWTQNQAIESLSVSTFGVKLMAPVDNYRQTERTVKYATLFILLMFTAYFLFEVMAKLKIHPFQYILVGAAICVFYLGILALSEFCSFSWSYAASAFAAWAMISLYTRSVLKSGRKTLIISAILAILQASFYVMTQLQDYSMIFGTVMLFVAIASVMFVTRRLDWYDNIQESTDASSQAPGGDADSSKNAL